MTGLIVSIIFFFIGLWSMALPASRSAAPWLNRANYYLLLVLLTLLFAIKGLDSSLLPLFVAGLLLQALPAIIGIAKARCGHANWRDYFIFSTYGGGNRGVLLLSLAYPEALQAFLVVDLGNFLSMLLIFPLAQGLAIFGGKTGGNWRDKLPLLWPVLAIATGLTLRVTISDHAALQHFQEVIKILLNIGVSAYLGLQFRLSRLAVGTLLKRMAIVRVVGVGLALMLAVPILWLAGVKISSPLAVAVLVFFILPVSSLLPAMAKDTQLRDQAVNDVVGSSVIFVALLPAAILLGLWLS